MITKHSNEPKPLNFKLQFYRVHDLQLPLLIGIK